MKNTTIKVGIAAIALSFSQFSFADNIYTIYPIPQQQIAAEGTAKVTTKVNVVLENGIDEATKARIADVLKQHQLEYAFSDKAVESETNIYLGINGSGEIADQKATSLNLSRNVFSIENKYDRHCLNLSVNNGIADIVILGENTDATFIGIASLEQMLENDLNALPCVSIYDYADQKSRGIVEGYYGYPYSVEVKKDLMRFMMRYKMNTYLYGAKSDPYHSHYWKDPYPNSLTAQQIKNGWMSQDMIKDVSKVSHDTKVNFIWAIHPGNDILNSSTVVKDVTDKFDKMYKLGVRQFAVFVDDVGVPEADQALATNAQNISNIQKAIEKKYNVEGAAAADTIKPLHFVPQVYCASFAGTAEKRQKFFKSLQAIPSNVVVYTTGWGVWSVPNQSDFNLINDELGRPGAWWWNYPCNDNADSRLYPMDMYSNFCDMPAVNNNARLPRDLNNGLGIVCNPMQQGEVAKIPIFSAADYAWNTSGFNNMGSWNAAFPAIVGKEKASSLQLLAKYIRYNDPEGLNSLINRYKSDLEDGHPNVTNLSSKMTELSEACQVIETLKDSPNESDRLLYKDLTPWFAKVKQMATSINQLLQISAMSNEDFEKWNGYLNELKYVDALDTAEIYKAYALEGMGNNISVSVRPAEPAQKYLYPFVKYLKDNSLMGYFPTKEERNLRISNIEKYRGYANTLHEKNYLLLSSVVLEKGDYVGIELTEAQKLSDFTIADTLVSNYSVIYSKNGKDWIKYTDKETLLKDFVKYVCIQNNSDNTKSLRLSRKSICVQSPKATGIASVTIPQGDIWDNHTAIYLTDGDYNSFVCLNRNQRNGDLYTLKLTKLAPVYDVRVCMGTVNGDHMNVGNVEISKDGNTWTKVRVKGTHIYDFTMNMPQVVKYSDEMCYCDFDADGKEALYVRFNVTNARTNKWLRFYELEVNKKGDKLQYLSECVDSEGAGIEELSDRLAHTYMKDVKQSLTCNFNDIYYLKEVKIYQDASVSANNPASISVSLDGEEWQDYGNLTENVQVIDLSQNEKVQFMKIEWTGNAPKIYEIVPVTDQTKQPEVTKVEQLTTANPAIDFSYNGRTMQINSASGIKSVDVFTLNGKIVMTYQAAAAKFVQLPVFADGNSAYIVKVTSENGEISTYKISCH